MSKTLYTILEAPSTQSLQQQVRDHLDNGWKLSGGPFTFGWSAEHGAISSAPAQHPGFDGWIYLTFCQAMTQEIK